jgi:uncharacterized NAD(P)/FAD-binding protein YdhS
MRVAILGFGFSGAMVAANLVRAADAPLTLYIIDPEITARGVAYATENADHLLNVRAANMGAFADAADGFAQWLMTDAAKQAQAARGIARNFSGSDFAPRALYGDYLQSVWQQTQEIAAQKKMDIKLIPSRAVAVQAGATPAVLTERGDAIAVDRIVLAVGHEVRPIWPQLPASSIIHNPWAAGALDGAAQWAAPVMLVGTGLTAVDMVLTLRKAGYAGEILAGSRHGWLPQAHAVPSAIFSCAAEEMAAQKTLRQWVQWLRNSLRHVGEWRVVIDALRPHTQRIWQSLATPDQQRFLTKLLPFWNVHRHRMAPDIAARIQAEIAAGTLRILSTKRMTVIATEGGQIVVNTASQRYTPSRILNCTGPELNIARSANPLLRQLLADGLVEPHVNGLGITADTQLRAWGRLHPNLYAMGALLTGQLLESTAVPELRAQAAMIAHAIVK